ncbi:MAG: two-component system CheB/CheR fusion protein [Sulfurimonas sp.]|jgi:two-component system CheB/CheR fusion protein
MIKNKNNISVVGIGASAGGLIALENFFSSLPTDLDANVAFVVIQHLSPEHHSILAEIISRYTKMQVFEVQDKMVLKPNCTYIIPPRHNIALHNGKFELLELSKERGQKMPIDFFFASLAHEIAENSIAIVLSGTGSDGTKGIRYIKQEGGLAIAQRIDTAEFEDMPKNAINTGLVDYELTTQEMGSTIINHILHNDSTEDLSSSKSKDSDLHKIFTFLMRRTGHDFSMYKRNTLNRRIKRRMLVHRTNTMKDYVEILNETPSEIDALFKDFLIGVTNFFRNKEAFDSLEKNVISKLFKDKEFDSTIRIWVAGCSTGEEAYSIAILLKEYMNIHSLHNHVQIFASDIDARAIATARNGLFSKNTVAEISEQRLKSFFTKSKDDGYHINKKIRDMIIFSEHDVIKDPPFSKLDLVSCRNLMIYMNVKLQQKLLPLFHYALNANGILFLGNSESIGSFDELFTPIDQEHKIFLCKSITNSLKYITSTKNPYIPKAKNTLSNKNNILLEPIKLPLKDLTEQGILNQLAPSAILIDEDGNILYLYGHAGAYLEMPEGEIGINNIFKMLKEDIEHEIARAVKKVKADKLSVTIDSINAKVNGIYKRINIRVSYIINSLAMQSKQQVFLILFEEIPVSIKEHINKDLLKKVPLKNTKVDRNQDISKLRKELQIQEKILQEANERLAISNEELKSFNEEMQSMNEELQSTNEELETSREELQSVNEELSTVNAELQTKVSDLSRSNNDMNNLLTSTGIGTVFVDHNINIVRFTLAVKKIINLIDSDVGRPISHIVSNILNYKNLLKDIQNVLNTLIPKEMEVQIESGDWYFMRIQPYRSTENVIEGAVISFIEMTNIIKIREELKEAQSFSYMAKIVHDSRDAIVMHTLDGKIISWNPSAKRIYGWSEKEALSMNEKERIPKFLQEEDLQKLEELSKNETIEPYSTKRLTKDGDILNIMIISTAVFDKNGIFYAIATTERANNLKI